METLFRFDDASVSPTSLQNVLNNPSAYVIFYEMLETTRNQIVSSTAASAEIKPKVTPAVSPAGPERKVIGPQLPSPAPSVAKIPPSPGTIPFNPNQGSSPLVKPEVITESPIVRKPPLTPVKIGGLFHSDGDSDSEEEVSKTKLKTKSPPTPIQVYVRDIDSHSPSVHSDNSSGSTTSFTVSDIGSGAVRSGASATDNYLSTSRQKRNVVPHAGSSAANGKSEQHSKPGADRKDAVSEYSEVDSHGLTKKRKKTALFENGGSILGKFGKEIFNAGAKTTTDRDDATACEATTSQSHEKASSYKLSVDKDSQKKHKKKNPSGPERKVTGQQMPSPAPSEGNHNMTLRHEIQWDHTYGSIPGQPEHSYVTNRPHQTPPRRTQKAGGEYWNITLTFFQNHYFCQN